MRQCLEGLGNPWTKGGTRFFTEWMDLVREVRPTFGESRPLLTLHLGAKMPNILPVADAEVRLGTRRVRARGPRGLPGPDGSISYIQPKQDK